MAKLFKTGRGIRAKVDMQDKGIKKGDRGDIVRQGSPLTVCMHRINRILQLTQKEQGRIEVYDSGRN